LFHASILQTALALHVCLIGLMQMGALGERHYSMT